MMMTSTSLQHCCFASICFAKSTHSQNLIFYSRGNFENIKMHHRKCIAKTFQVERSCWSCCWSKIVIILVEIHVQYSFSVYASISVPHINPSVYLLCSKLHKTHCVLEVNKPTNPAGCRTQPDELGEKERYEIVVFALLRFLRLIWEILKFRLTTTIHTHTQTHLSTRRFGWKFFSSSEAYSTVYT